MPKVVFGVILGGILGVLDGLSALVSAPETDPATVEDVGRIVPERVLLAQVDDARGVGDTIDRAAAVVLVA